MSDLCLGKGHQFNQNTRSSIQKFQWYWRERFLNFNFLGECPLTSDVPLEPLKIRGRGNKRGRDRLYLASVRHAAALPSSGCLTFRGQRTAPGHDAAQAQPPGGEVTVQRRYSGCLLHPGGLGQWECVDRTPGVLKSFFLTCESLSFRVEVPATTLTNVHGDARKTESPFAAQRMLATKFRWGEGQASGLPCRRKTLPSTIGTRCISNL